MSIILRYVLNDKNGLWLQMLIWQVETLPYTYIFIFSEKSLNLFFFFFLLELPGLVIESGPWGQISDKTEDK